MSKPIKFYHVNVVIDMMNRFSGVVRAESPSIAMALLRAAAVKNNELNVYDDIMENSRCSIGINVCGEMTLDNVKNLITSYPEVYSGFQGIIASDREYAYALSKVV